MKKLLSIIAVAVLFAGCAAIAQKATEKTGVGVSASVETLSVETAEGATDVALSPGQSVELVALGYDANSREVTSANVSGAKVNPTWSVSDPEMGSVNPKQGKKTIFTLSEDASGMFVTVSANQEGASKGTIMVQIQ